MYLVLNSTISNTHFKLLNGYGIIVTFSMVNVSGGGLKVVLLFCSSNN